MKMRTNCQEAALIILRLSVAAIFLYAAYAKLPIWSGIPEGMTAGMANFMKFISVAEGLGGIALIIGFLTKWASIGLSIIMIGAIYTLQFQMGVGFATDTGAGWNFPLVILAACIALAAYGAGDYSVDAKIKK